MLYYDVTKQHWTNFYIILTLEIWRITSVMKPEIAFQIQILTYATNLH